MHGAGWGWWLLMSVGMVAFWAAAIYLLLWVVRGARPLRRQGPADDVPSEAPLALLQRRLAGGVIGIDEYKERRSALDDEPSKPSAHAAA
jgi:putative membrane protein